MNVVTIPLELLKPYHGNAKKHPQSQIEQIKESLEQFGNCDPIAVWGEDNLIVEGHGRYEALKQLGYHEAECIRLDHLTDEERRAYTLVHNKLTMNSGFDFDILSEELDNILSIDMGEFDFKTGFDFDSIDEAASDDDEEYQEFVEKYKPKKTTDDCYTPQNIYDAVLDYFANRYGFDKSKAVRPFYPGGDYVSFKYPEGCVVVDNPPFSILGEIKSFYIENEIPFVLFAPGLTALASRKHHGKIHVVAANATIRYANGAVVSTAFITSFEPEIAIESCPELGREIRELDKKNREETAKQVPKYEFPDHIVTAARVGRYSAYGVEYKLMASDCVFVSSLDSMDEAGRPGIFGGGLLMSEKAAAEKAAAEKAAAEKAAAEKWQLSERELEIVRSLGGE